MELLVWKREGAAQQAVRPGGVDTAAMAKNFNGTARVGPAQKDNVTSGRSGIIWAPVTREGFARSAVSVIAETELLDVSVDETVAAGAYLSEGSEIKTVPDFALPEAVEVFDRGLEARLTRGSKHGCNAETQATADDAADRAGRMASAVEAQVVVELSVVGQTFGAPIRGECVDDGESGPMRSYDCESGEPVQGPARENVEGARFSQPQAFDEVEAIELSVGSRQIPAPRGSEVSLAPSRIHEPLSVQNPVNRSYAWRSPPQQRLKSGAYGSCADEPKIMFGELAPHPANGPLHGLRGLSRIAFGT